jgi:hypothetical protein
MAKVPWLFSRLFKELDLDAPHSIWGIEPRTDAETLFTEIYVLQTKDLWNTPEATALLMEIAHTIPNIDISKALTVDNSEMTLDVVRFVYLDNKPTLMAMAPSNLLHRSNNSDADPLPPDTNKFSYDSQRIQIEGSRSMVDDYNNPFAAMRQFLPDMSAIRNVLRIPRQAGEEDDEYHARADREARELQNMIENEADIGEVPPPPGFLHRLLMSMFGGGRGDESESEAGTDTDDGMPDMEPMDWGESEDEYFSDELPPHVEESDEESDDEMPALIPNT